MKSSKVIIKKGGKKQKSMNSKLKTVDLINKTKNCFIKKDQKIAQPLDESCQDRKTNSH